ncbi:MAG: hypothetical protein ACTS5G_00075 [Burkholderiales bacterium]
MHAIPNENEKCCRLVFDGAMTRPHSREMEDRIIDSMRRYPRLDVDLSGVTELDLCGVHLLGVLRSFGEKMIRIVGASPLVEEALARQQPMQPRLHRRNKAAGLARSVSQAPPHAGSKT